MEQAKIERIWHWNHKRSSTQQSMQKDIFIPKIFCATVDGTLATAVVWVDGIAACLPEVDYMLIPQHELYPRKWFQHKTSGKDLVLASYDTVTKNLHGYEKAPMNGYECWIATSEHRSPQLERWVKTLKATDAEIKLVNASRVLNSEYCKSAA